MKIRLTTLIQFFIFILLILDVPYIKHTIGFLWYLYMGLEAIVIALLVFAYCRRPSLSPPVVILLAYTVYMLLVSLANGSGVAIYAVDFLPILLVCLYFNLEAGGESVSIAVLRRWIAFLTCLVVIDIITIILFPKGLYLGSDAFHASGQRNWFLGYKTNRLTYSFPLVVLYSYYLFIKGKFRLKNLVLYAVVFFDMYLTHGTAGSYTLLLFLLVSAVYVNSLSKKRIAAERITRILRKYYLFLAIFVFITLTAVLVQSSISVVSISALFGKSSTLQHRTIIWQYCAADIGEHFLFGHGVLGGTQYAKITGGYVNPHNIVFSYMLTGGFIGLLFVLIYFLCCVRRVKGSEENVLFLLAVYCILILGITSSTLSFSPFLFTFMLLMYDRREETVHKGIIRR